MTNQIKVNCQSIDEATIKLALLFNRLNSHKVYTDLLVGSSGETREEVGLLTDEFNAMKTTVGKLIDGTRIALRETNEQFAAADKSAALPQTQLQYIFGDNPSLRNPFDGIAQ